MAPEPPRRHPLSHRAFVLLVVAVSAAFAWIVWPFFGPILWATILAILFRPVHRRIGDALRRRGTLAALVTLLLVLLIVILPATLLAIMLIRETSGLFQAVQSGEIDLAAIARNALSAMPDWLDDLLESLGLTDPGTLQQRLSGAVMRGAQVLSVQVLSFGQNAIEFVVNVFIALYLLFFFLRDGETLVVRIRRAVPLQEQLQQHLFAEFTNMTRAMVKGTIVVAIVQGMLGGLILWIMGIRAPVFWGVVMAFASLLPAIGTALVWSPIALYLLATGAVVKGIVLVAYGVLVIGLVDNVLRPVLVGKDTRIPDHVVLISTLGGIAVLGLNGLLVGPVIAALFVAVWAVVSASREAAN